MTAKPGETLWQYVKRRRRAGLPVGRDLAQAALSDAGDLPMRRGYAVTVRDGTAVHVRTGTGNAVPGFTRGSGCAEVEFLRFKAHLIAERVEERERERRERLKKRGAAA